VHWESEAQSPAQLCQMLGLALDQKLMHSPAGNWQKVSFTILWRIASFVNAHLTSSCRLATLKQLTNACDASASGQLQSQAILLRWPVAFAFQQNRLLSS